MWIKKPQKLTSNLIFLGDFSFSCYLVVGERSLLFDGGVTAYAPTVYQQLKGALDDSPLDYLVISDPHFDGLGMLPYLRRMYPKLQVIASEATRAFLQQKNARKLLRRQNEEIISRSRRRNPFPHFDMSFDRALSIDQIVSGGETIDLGGVSLEVLSLPGHTAGSLGLFMSSGRTVLAGESLGLYYAPLKSYADFGYDYGEFVESLKRVQDRMPRRIGMTHFGVLDDADAVRLPKLTLETAAEMYERLGNLVCRDVPTDKICQEFMDTRYRDSVRLLPVSVFLSGVRNMIDVVSRDLLQFDDTPAE